MAYKGTETDVLYGVAIENLVNRLSSLVRN
jgi:hypothetical protein